MTQVEIELARELAMQIKQAHEEYASKCAELVRHLKVCEGADIAEAVGYDRKEGEVLVKPKGHFALDLDEFIACVQNESFTKAEYKR